MTYPMYNLSAIHTGCFLRDEVEALEPSFRKFAGPAMTLAAIDRFVHHATIFEINVDSYRCQTALERKQKAPGGLPITRQSILCKRQSNLG